MNVVTRTRTRTRMLVEEFLAWEERQEARHEFDGDGPVAMVGGTSAHNLIAVDLITELNVRLRGTPCRVYGSDMKVEAAGHIRRPDACVACLPVDGRATVLRDPVVIFEVLSESTAFVDQTSKNREYRDTPSVQRYVMLSQDAVLATVFERRGGEWVGTLADGPGAVLRMPEIGAELPLASLYDGVVPLEA